MKNSVTIRDVASYTGLSVGTVSMALNDSDKIAAKTKKIVAEAVETLGFKRNPFARSLSTKTSKIIGCIVPDITNQFYGEMVSHLQEELDRRDYGLVIGFANENCQQEARLISQFIDRGVDGIISVPVADPQHNIAQIKKLYEDDFPIVFIAAYYQSLPHYTVMADIEDGMCQLVTSLLRRGFRNILCLVGDSDLVPSQERLRGMKRAYAQEGLEFNPENIITAKGVTYRSGYEAIEEIKKRATPEVVIAINDIMAMGILSALRSNGYRVPADVKVAGFDDISNAEFLETPLTTVSQSLDLMCKEAVDLLLRRMSGEKPSDGIKKVPTRLILRESTK